MLDQEMKNRAFEEMRKAALARLSGRDPGELSRRTGMAYDPVRQCFALESLGQAVTVSYPGYAITPALDDWHQLLLLHYMDMADGTAPTGQLTAFGDQPGGMVRGGGFDRQSERELSLGLGRCTPDVVKAVCRGLGGKLCPSNADVCAVFSLFPHYPVTLKLWFADEEIPGSGRLFLDRSAGHQLSVEDAVTAGTLLLNRILTECAALSIQEAQPSGGAGQAAEK